MGRSKDENVELRRKWRLFLVLKQLENKGIKVQRDIKKISA